MKFLKICTVFAALGLLLTGCDAVFGPRGDQQRNQQGQDLPWIVCAPTGMSPQACSVINVNQNAKCNLAIKSRHASQAEACAAARAADECNTQPNVLGC